MFSKSLFVPHRKFLLGEGELSVSKRNDMPCRLYSDGFGFLSTSMSHRCRNVAGHSKVGNWFQ
jgi:hypothetical protein